MSAATSERQKMLIAREKPEVEATMRNRQWRDRNECWRTEKGVGTSSGRDAGHLRMDVALAEGFVHRET